MAQVREYKIETLASFLALLEREKRVEENRGRKADFLFRGQDVDEPLVPTLARRRLRGALPNIERLMLNEFERVTPPLRELPINNDWDLLAVAQHHGLPTRLLDWTFSATAALWFVVRNPPARDAKSKPRDGVVWVLKPSTDDFVDIRPKETPFEGKRTRIFRPAVIARRIAAQAGVFTVHKLLAGKRFVALERHRLFSAKLAKIHVPARAFALLRRELHSCGVNYASMFPDLDGACQHLTWRYTWFEDER